MLYGIQMLKKAAPLLKKALSDENKNIRERAAEILDLIGSDEDRAEVRRNRVRWDLQEIANSPTTSLFSKDELLIALLHRNVDVRDEATDNLNTQGKQSESS